MSKRKALAAQVLNKARRAGLTVGTAESCTGGWIGKSLTDPAGSSAVFVGGIVTYSNASKMRVLNVPKTAFKPDGAVSRAVVEAMAEGANALLYTDIVVAVTGVAGPGGGSEAKPVGTVWFALAQKGKPVQSIMQSFGNKGRDQVRKLTVIYALEWLDETLDAQAADSGSDV